MHTREIAAYGGLVEPDAGLRAGLHAVHARQRRAAGDERLRGRVPDAGRGVPGLDLGGVLRRDGGDPLAPAMRSGSTGGWCFGDLIKESLKTIQDMGRREKLIFAPLVAAMLAARGLSRLRARRDRALGRGADRPYRDGAGGRGPRRSPSN